jgi:RND family efflux transporter MFP subunit
MSENQNQTGTQPIPTPSLRKRNTKIWSGAAIGVVAVAVIGVTAIHWSESSATPAPSAAALPSVVVSTPLQRDLAPRLGFLGQFSAVQKVELRAQVGGTLTEIRFKDGDIVHKGDLLFVIDPVPYEIRMSEAKAQLASANARLTLATQQLARAQTLKSADAGSAEDVEQRSADSLAAQAAVEGAKAQVRDAQFDLDHTRITAPFTGRIGTHLVSTGNLISGSRAGNSPTTLLTTLVSVDPIYLNFDMSESDYAIFSSECQKQKGPLADKVQVSMGDENGYNRQGTLDFVDNALDSTSGTIHARATVPNSDLSLTPGGFGRVRFDASQPTRVLLVPDAAVLPDQSGHIVLTVDPSGVVTPKPVEVGDLRGGLRVIRSGLSLTDKVVIEGIPTARPGSKVSPNAGSIQFGSDQSKG